jgi:hypothetical protein
MQHLEHHITRDFNLPLNPFCMWVGIGMPKKADLVRIIWPPEVPQRVELDPWMLVIKEYGSNVK